MGKEERFKFENVKPHALGSVGGSTGLVQVDMCTADCEALRDPASEPGIADDGSDAQNRLDPRQYWGWAEVG